MDKDPNRQARLLGTLMLAQQEEEPAVLAERLEKHFLEMLLWDRLTDEERKAWKAATSALARGVRLLGLCPAGREMQTALAMLEAAEERGG